MLEAIILGAMQGVAEWLPVSSEGITVLLNNFFSDDLSLKEGIDYALFLHLGTFLAAFFYFRKDVLSIIRGVFTFRKAEEETQRLILFLFFSTLVSGGIGFLFLHLIDNETFDVTGPILMLFVGIALAVTGLLQWAHYGASDFIGRAQKKPSFETIKGVAKDFEGMVSARINPTVRKQTRKGVRSIKDIDLMDAIVLGVMQGLTILPGISRSGTTIAFLLMRNIDSAAALRLSFLMSLPVVLGANLYANYDMILNPTKESLMALFMAFLLGLITIHALLSLARKVNFSIFVFMLSGFTIALSLYFIIS